MAISYPHVNFQPILPSSSIRNHNFKFKFHISFGSRAQKRLKVFPYIPWDVRKVSSTLDHHLKFPSAFGRVSGRAAINSPAHCTSKVLILTKPPNKLLPSQPLKMPVSLEKCSPITKPRHCRRDVPTDDARWREQFS